MHPIIQEQLVKARIADWHAQAERDRMTRAARLARRARDRRSVPDDLATVLARWVRALLAAHRPRAQRSQPAEVRKATP
jgi:hypothetical protein